MRICSTKKKIDGRIITYLRISIKRMDYCHISKLINGMGDLTEALAETLLDFRGLT